MRITVPDDLKTANTTTDLIVEDPGTEWVAGTYALGQEVWKATTHRVYRCAAASTTDDPEDGVLANPATWTDVRPTNEWAFKDAINTTQTVKADSLQITHTMTTTGYLSEIDLFNLAATDVQITLTSAQAGGQIHNVNYSLENFDNINDLFDYRYAAFLDPEKSLSASGWQEYSDTVATITINNAGTDAKVGNVVIGEKIDLGDTLTEFTTPILDYSRRIVDEFGNTTLKNFGVSKQFRGQVAIPIGRVNYVYQTLSELASIPVSFVGDDRYTGSIVFGTVSIIPAYDVTDVSIATVKVEGLK